MSIEAVFPVPRRRAPAAPQGVVHTWKPLPAKPVLGLIDNTKSRARDLLEAVGNALVRRGVVASWFLHSKPSPSHPIGPEVRAEIAAKAHLIVSGVGD